MSAPARLPSQVEAWAEARVSPLQPSMAEPPWLADVRLRALRRVLWLRECWSDGSYGDESAMAISHSEVDRALAEQAAVFEHEEAFHAREPRAAELTTMLAALGPDVAWEALTSELNLTPTEANLLALAVAAEAMPALRRVYGYLRDGVAASDATPGLAASLWRWPPGTSVGLAGGLRQWQLARPSADCVFPCSPDTEWRADPALLRYLLPAAVGATPDGNVPPRFLTPPPHAQQLAPAELTEIVSFLRATCAAPANASPDVAVSVASRSWNSRQLPVEVEIVGPAGAGRSVLAAQTAAVLQMPLLAADASALRDGDSVAAAVRQARAALLSGAAILWPDADTMEPGALAAVRGLVPCSFLTTSSRLPAHADGRTVRWTSVLPVPDRAGRLALWSAIGPPVPAPAPVAEWPLRPGEIITVARAALAGGHAAKRVAKSLLLPVGREQVTSLQLPYTWDDLVLPRHISAQLHELAEQARDREQLIEDWGLRRLTPMGSGLTSLFAGPSGTGKTMAAQVLARSLGLELLCVDLAGVVSKYVGETEKMLRAVFDACERAPAILFFDEADALFGRRTQVTDAHDRFANIEIDYLLQRMERFSGFAVLASNRKGDLDEAFLRRLRFIVEFVPPSAAERERLWRLCLEGSTDTGGRPLTGDIDYPALAAEIDLTGAGIKAAALAAAFLARTDGTVIGMRHLRAAAGRELGKQGMQLRPGTEAIR